MKKTVFAFACLASLAVPTAAIAASPEFAQGVSAYRAHHYNEALGLFGLAQRKAPNDMLVRYYEGLCYQGMNQMTPAGQEYAYVAENATGQLQQQAQYALGNISHFPRSVASANPAPTTANKSSTTTVQHQVQNGPKFQGRLTIYEFTKGNCLPCTQFEPIWQSVSARMGSKAQFKQINCDDPSNKQLVDKYRVAAFPMLVYTDQTGNVLRQTAGAPRSEDQWMNEINFFFR